MTRMPALSRTLPTWYKGTEMHPSPFSPLTTTPFLVLNTTLSPSLLRSSIIVMLRTSRISAKRGMLSKLASFLSIGWRTFRMSEGNLGGLRGSIFLMRISPPRLVQGTVTPAAQ